MMRTDALRNYSLACLGGMRDEGRGRLWSAVFHSGSVLIYLRLLFGIFLCVCVCGLGLESMRCLRVRNNDLVKPKFYRNK